MLQQIGPITSTVIDAILNELKKKETRDKIHEEIFNPLLMDVTSKYYSYFVFIIILLVLIIVLLTSLLVSSIKQHN